MGVAGGEEGGDGRHKGEGGEKGTDRRGERKGLMGEKGTMRRREERGGRECGVGVRGEGKEDLLVAANNKRHKHPPCTPHPLPSLPHNLETQLLHRHRCTENGLGMEPCLSGLQPVMRHQW